MSHPAARALIPQRAARRESNDHPSTDATVRSAVAHGLLPPAPRARRKTPVLGRCPAHALGAWLVALPLLGVVGTLFGPLVQHGVGPYVFGPIVLAGCHRRAAPRPPSPLFVEQLITPALIVGAALLGWGAYRDLPPAMASVTLALVALACAFAIPRPWLRVVLGAAAATLVVLAWLPGRWLSSRHWLRSGWRGTSSLLLGASPASLP